MEQLRILIADDEEAARTALKSLNWEHHGCVLVGEAEDGRQVLEMLDHTSIDVILLDIGMPVMNGLELANIITKRYPHIKIIFLTMHREFDYAIEAMRLKAFDYLIKDVSNTERLFASLTRLRMEKYEKNLANQAEKEKILLERMERPVAEHFPRLRPIRMVRLLKKNQADLKYPLLHTERCLLQLPGCGACLPVHENEWLIFGCKDENALLEAMQEEWGEAFHVTICLESCADITSAIKKGGIYLEEGFYHPERRFLKEGAYIQEFSGQMMVKFQADIRACFYDVAHDANVLNEWLAECARLHILPSAVKRLLISMIPTNVASQTDPSTLISALWNAYTSSEVAALFRSYLLKARLTGSARRVEVERVESYIRTHLNGNLSIQALSEQIGLSPNYLNRLFREQMNESLKSYVIRIRMETAAKMLKNSDMRINEVAIELGYPSSRYFSEAFAKHYGVTPKDYRRGK